MPGCLGDWSPSLTHTKQRGAYYNTDWQLLETRYDDYDDEVIDDGGDDVLDDGDDETYAIRIAQYASRITSPHSHKGHDL